MSIVEKIQNLPENTVTQDDNFIMLSEALSEYHRLIQEGKLVCKFRLIGPRIPLRTDQPFRM